MSASSDDSGDGSGSEVSDEDIQIWVNQC